MHEPDPATVKRQLELAFDDDAVIDGYGAVDW